MTSSFIKETHKASLSRKVITGDLYTPAKTTLNIFTYREFIS